MIGRAQAKFLSLWRMAAGIIVEVFATFVMMAAVFVVGFFIVWWFSR